MPSKNFFEVGELLEERLEVILGSHESHLELHDFKDEDLILRNLDGGEHDAHLIHKFLECDSFRNLAALMELNS